MMIKKIYLIILLNIIFSICCECQITFNKRVIIDSLPSLITSIYPTDSCYYGIGVVSDSINLLSFGNSLYKFDLEGNLLFEKRLAKTNKTYEFVRQLKLNNLEELYTVGHTKDTSEVNWKSIFIKYNLQGDTILTKEYISPIYYNTGNPEIYPLEILQTPDSGYIFIANAAGIYKNIAIYKINKYGNQEWVKTYGGTNKNIVYNIIEDNGTYIVCGAYNTNGLAFDDGIWSMYLLCIDPLGNELWSYVAPIEDEMRSASDIVRTDDGGFIVSYSINTDFINNTDYFVGSTAKLSSNLEVEWQKPIYHQPHSRVNFLYDIVETKEEIDTEFTAWGIQYGLADNTYGLQPWLAKVSLEGDSIWSRDYTFLGLSPHQRHQFFDVRKTSDGGYIACGESIDFSPDGSGDGQKGWLIKLDEYGCLVPGCHIETSDENIEKSSPLVIKTYPNPTTDFLNIYFKHQDRKRDGIFRLMDLQGRVVLEFAANRNDTTYMVDVERFESGVYFLQYWQADDSQDGKRVAASTNKIIIRR